MTLTIVPRAVIGLPEPPASRPLLRLGVEEIIAHYTGVNGYAADPRLDLQYAKSVAYYGMHRTVNGVLSPVPYEYCYLIGPGGTVYEQAGRYKGAHCLNWNYDSLGVLFMLGIGVEPTAAAIESWHDLCDYLVATGQLARHHRRLPHYARRATGCCGLTLATPIGKRLAFSPTGEGSEGSLLPALLQRGDVIPTPTPPPPAPAPEPTPTQEGTVFTALVTFAGHPAVYACYSDGTKKWIAPGAGPAFRYLHQQAGHSTEMIVVDDPDVMRAFGPIACLSATLREQLNGYGRVDDFGVPLGVV